MPEANRHSHRIAASLANRIENGADAAHIAGVIAAAMTGIAANLSPIIGNGGVVALYRRSCHLLVPLHPWLATSDSTRAEIDTAGLKSLLAKQSTADAAQAGGALLQTFSDVLVSLVGAPLGDRLLQPVWESFPIVPLATNTTSP